MRILSRADLERIAERVLRAYWTLPSAQRSPWRVDPCVLAQELLGLKIRYRRLSSDGLTHGLTSFSSCDLILPDSETCGICSLDGKTILLERDLLTRPEGFGRRNFTCAHECAHHILKRLYPLDYGGGSTTRQIHYCRDHAPEPFDWEEWQMDTLASALLMPPALVRANLVSVGAGEGLSGSFAGHDGRAALQLRWVSDSMRVSKQALVYRLRQLGLLRSVSDSRQQALPDIYMDEEDY